MKAEKKAKALLNKRFKTMKRKYADAREGLEHMHGKKRFLCIKIRNEYVKGRLTADFERRRLAHARASSELHPHGSLHVMPASSSAYFKNGHSYERDMGFPTKEYSGIPQIRQWVAVATSPYREEHLDEALNIYRRLFDTIQDWCAPGQGLIGMSKEEIIFHCEDVSTRYQDVSTA